MHEITVPYQNQSVGKIEVQQKSAGMQYVTRTAHGVQTFKSEQEARDHVLFVAGMEAAAKLTTVGLIKQADPMAFAGVVDDAARESPELMKELAIALAWMWDVGDTPEAGDEEAE